MNYLYIFSLFLVLGGCASKEELIQTQVEPQKEIVENIQEQNNSEVINELEVVQDLLDIPQKPDYFASKTEAEYLDDIDSFIQNYFRPWHIDTLSMNKVDASWAYTYDNNNSYGYTLQILEKDFFDHLKENTNLEAFATLNTQGVTLGLVNLRALPTDKPVFLDPSQAGEGYPFDYLQNSSLAPNKPVLISHYSKDKKWVFIECSFGFGWVKAGEIVAIDRQYTPLWEQAEQIFLLKDGKAMYDQDGNYLFTSRIGMVLPLIEEDEGSYTVLCVRKTAKNMAYFVPCKIDKKIANKGILEFNAQNISNILGEIQKGKYGWGGIYAQRDCSSTIRDFYTPFGLWLPRNSSVQSNVGDIAKVEKLSNDEKVAVIKEKGIPFKTFVYKQGHIGIYVGTFNNQAVIFQNVWGVKTKEDGVEGRFIIGRPVFTTLEAGKNLHFFDPEASMLTQLKSINTIR